MTIDPGPCIDLTERDDLLLAVSGLNKDWNAMLKRAEAAETKLVSARKALEFLMQTKWRSVDKDNMEFEGRITCYQLDAIRAALSDSTTGGE